MKANVKYEENDKGVFDYNLSNHKIGEISGFRNFDGTQKDIVCLGAARQWEGIQSIPMLY